MSKTVVVGMSGGVDSSVAALLLKQQGWNVIGMFMKNWDDRNDPNCPAAQDYDDVVAVCNQIGIPCYAVNFSEHYWDNVFEHFLDELRAGRTPNPDILCNREIKFKVLMEKAKSLGADYLATGHYCRTNDAGDLLKGLDPAKDQSYFLYAVTSQILKNVLFPIGELPKAEVRKIAKEFGLATHSKKDSTGICFIGKRNFKDFVSQYLAYSPGNLIDLDGKVVGKHDGAAYLTVGQRHGLGIGGAGEPWFVVSKNIETNEVTVVQGGQHPALFKSHLVARDLTWVSEPPPVGKHLLSKIRYRQSDQPCIIDKMENDQIFVTFPEPQRAVTPGQSIVLYDGDRCLGGGIIC